MRTQRNKRPAFTIVEMMVAMALILVIMTIIAQTFGAASKTYTELRVAGQLQERIRLGSGVIRKDLTAEHFDGPFIPGRSGPRVGDQRLDLAGWVPPYRGYFEIRQYAPSFFEPTAAPGLTDGEGLRSTRAESHVLRFTSHLPNLPSAELFCAAAPAATPGNAFPTGQPIFYSRWAEIEYFLAPSGDTTPPNAAGVSLPMYSLRRRIRLLAPRTTVVDPNMQAATAATIIATYPEVAFSAVALPPPAPAGQVMLRILGPEDIGNPGNRMPLPPSPVVGATGFQTGDDILLTDVLSFEVKAAWFHNQSPSPLSFNAITPGSSPPAQTVTAANSDAPFSDLPQSVLNTTGLYLGQRVFDTYYRQQLDDSGDFWERPQALNGNSQAGFLTAGTYQPPVRINVRTIQIKIRVWDTKAERARQVTIVQEI